MCLNTPEMQTKASVDPLSMLNDNGNWIVTEMTGARRLLTISLECEMRVSKHYGVFFASMIPVHTNDVHIFMHVRRCILGINQSND